jgi:molecular chaperone GrpE
MNESENKHSESENTASNQAEQDQVDNVIDTGQAASSDESIKAALDSSMEFNAEQSSDQGELDLVAQLESAQVEIVKLKDAFLRAKAEEDNIRRRSEKEVANSRKFAVEGFAKEMVNVHDSLKLALSVELAEDADQAIKSTHEGVSITLKQLESAFAKFSVTEIVPESGDKLDPNLHQAMSLIESEEVDSGQIISVIQVGFSLHDRLLRPALVVVAK